ncbi:hypothetical protein QR510_31550, partial [Escherichia coli]|uniref:hypothetical protein n=1 Tax=Escherichia coli TaxID=562 RepID=UPI002738E039
MVRRSNLTTGCASCVSVVPSVEIFLQEWKKANPTGFTLHSPKNENPLLSVYEYHKSTTEYGQVAFQPTFER